MLSGVYGPNDDRELRNLWAELKAAADDWGSPRCLTGDFNTMRFPNERTGGDRITTATREFSEFINEMQLMDFPLEGGTYTRSNNHDTFIMSCIDRFLASID